jgi:hypothetical protein
MPIYGGCMNFSVNCFRVFKVSSVVLVSYLLTACGPQSESSLKSPRDNNRTTVAKPDFSGAERVTLRDNNRFPTHPDFSITPGSLCAHADELRYPEHINYCNRNVDRDTKAEIFKVYDRKLGFHTTEMDRNQFKIDHLIPLCMGGSNHSNNLWPQHQDVYAFTDPVEPYLCDLMSVGRLKQADGIRIIKEIKMNPTTAPKRIHDLD